MSSDTGARARRVAALALVAAAAFASSGCQTAMHTVGTGANGGERAEMRQWYALWGFLALGGSPDPRTVADGRSNYTVYSRFAFLDVVTNVFTAPFGFYVRSYTVEF